MAIRIIAWCWHWWVKQERNQRIFPANIYLFNVNNRNTRKRCEICSKLTIKTPERRQWRLMFSLLTLNMFHIFSIVSIVDFEQVKVSWVVHSALSIFKSMILFSAKFFISNYSLFYFNVRMIAGSFGCFCGNIFGQKHFGNVLERLMKMSKKENVHLTLSQTDILLKIEIIY